MSSLKLFSQAREVPAELLALVPRFSCPPSRSVPLTVQTSRRISTSSLPRVAQPSFWRSLIPRPLRKQSPSSSTESSAATSHMTWRDNPATPFVLLGLLCGSQALHIINLRQEVVAYSRKTDAKLAILREVVRRVQNGEQVDVEKRLGTGDPKSEKEWFEVLKEIEEDDRILQETKWQRHKRKKREAAAAREAEEPVEKPPEDDNNEVNRTDSNWPDIRPRFF